MQAAPRPVPPALVAAGLASAAPRVSLALGQQRAVPLAHPVARLARAMPLRGAEARRARSAQPCTQVEVMSKEIIKMSELRIERVLLLVVIFGGASGCATTSGAPRTDPSTAADATPEKTISDGTEARPAKVGKITDLGNFVVTCC